MTVEKSWIEVCGIEDIDIEDVLRFDHLGQTFAIYRSVEDTFHATAGLCTHECAYLADGLVIGDLIECPKHNGRFNYKTGEAKRVPAKVALETYRVKVEADRVLVELP